VKHVLGKILIILGAVMVSAACQKLEPSNGIYKVRIPMDDGSGNYVHTTAELRTVKNLEAMEAESTVIKTGGEIETKPADEGNLFYVEDSGGFTPKAQFLHIDDTYYPSNFLSLGLVTALYHFESVKEFFDTFGGNRHLSFPAIVRYDVKRIAHKNGRKYSSIDNAAYMPILDVFLLMPYEGDEVPLSLNGGVLAHEYFHRVYSARHDVVLRDLQKKGKMQLGSNHRIDSKLTSVDPNEWANVTSPAGVVKADTDSDIDEEEDKKNFERYNILVGRSINEAIADYFAYVYTRNPDWISPSLKEGWFRDVSHRKRFRRSEKAQKIWMLKSFDSKKLNDKIDVHILGAYFANFLYKVSRDWGNERTLAQTMIFLDRYFAKVLSQGTDKYFSWGKIADIFFESQKPGAKLCKSVLNIYSGEKIKACEKKDKKDEGSN